MHCKRRKSGRSSRSTCCHDRGRRLSWPSWRDGARIVGGPEQERIETRLQCIAQPGQVDKLHGLVAAAFHLGLLHAVHVDRRGDGGLGLAEHVAAAAKFHAKVE